MGRRPRPLPLNYDRLNSYLAFWRHGADLLKHMRATVLIRSAIEEGEISSRIGALVWLKQLRRLMQGQRFDTAGYQRWLSREPKGAILVPVWVIEELADALDAYEDGTYEETDLDEAFQARNQNKSAREAILDHYWWLALARMVFEEKIESELKGRVLSNKDAFERVKTRIGDTVHAPSIDTIRDAWRRWGVVLQNIEAAGLSFDK